MNYFSLILNFIVSYVIITKLIPALFGYLLKILLGVKINVKSIHLLNASICDFNVKWKKGEATVDQIKLSSKLFNKSYKKFICVLLKNVKISVFSGNELQEWYHTRNLIANITKFFETIEVTLENFSFLVHDVKMNIITEIHCRGSKLNSYNLEKRFVKGPSKNLKYLVVKSKDERWKNYPETYFYPEYNFFINEYKDFEVRTDDIFVAGFPRSGTTRLQELVWLIANDCDFETALKYDSEVRCPNFDNPLVAKLFRQNTLANSIDEMPSPRTLKIHLPIQLLPDQVWTKKPKIIFISRDVKDVAISNYHFWNLMEMETIMDINEYFECFMNDKIPYGPYRELVQGYMNIPNYENIIYITYETMHADLEGTIFKISKFLGKSVSSVNLKKLKEHLSFENMKKTSTTNNKQAFEELKKFRNGKVVDCNNFIRKGIIGDHKNNMSKEYIDRFDKWWTERNLLKQGF